MTYKKEKNPFEISFSHSSGYEIAVRKFKCKDCDFFLESNFGDTGEDAEGFCHLNPNSIQKWKLDWCSHFLRR